MADTYRGLTIRIGGDATSLQKALRSVNGSISATEQQLRKMKKALEMDPDNMGAIETNLRLVGQRAVEAQQRLAQLKRSYQEIGSQKVELFKGTSAQTVRQLADATEDANARAAEAKRNYAELDHQLAALKKEITSISGFDLSEETNVPEAVESLRQLGLISDDVADKYQRLNAAWKDAFDENEVAKQVAEFRDLEVEITRTDAEAKSLAGRFSELSRASHGIDFGEGLDDQLRRVDAAAEDVSSELRRLDSALRLDDGDVETLALKLRDMQEASTLAERRVELLSQKLERMDAAGIGRLSDETQDAAIAAQRAADEYDEACASVTRLKGELSELESRQSLLNSKDAAGTDEYRELGDQIRAARTQLDMLVEAQREAKAVVDTSAQVTEYRQLQTEIAEARAAQSKLNDEMREMGSFAGVTHGSLVSLGMSLSTTVTPAMVAMGHGMVQSADDIDSAYRDMRKTVEGTERDFEDLRQAAIDFSSTHVTSADQILSIQAIGGELGVATDDLKTFAEVVSNLDVATNLNAEEAATALGQLDNILSDLDGSTMPNFADALVRLGNNGASTEDQIANIASRIGSMGSIIGMSTPEILAWASTIASTGQGAEAAGTAISRTMSDIETAVANGGDALDAFAEIAGMSADEFATAWEETPSDAMKAFIDGLVSLEEDGGSAITTLDELGITAVRQVQSIQGLMQMIDGLDDNLEMSRDAWNGVSDEWGEAGDAAREADRKAEGFSGSLSRLQNMAQNVGAELGDSLVPVIDGVTDVLGDLYDMFVGLDDGTKQAIVAVGALAAAMGPLLLLGKGVSEFFGGFADGVRKLGRLANATDKVAGLTTALGGAEGAALSFGKVLSGGVVAGGIALAVGGVAALVAHIHEEAEKAENARKATEDLADACEAAEASMTGLGDASGSSATKLVDARDASDEVNESLAGLVDSFEELNAQTSATLSQLADARSSVEELGGRSDLTAEQVGRLKSAVEYLNSECGTNFDVVRESDGSYQIYRDGVLQTKDAIYELIDAQQRQVVVQSQMKKREDLYETRASQVDAYTAALEAQAAAQEKLDEAIERQNEVDAGGYSYDVRQQAAQNVSYYESELESANEVLSEQRDLLNGTDEQLRRLDETIGNVSESMSGAVDGFEALVKGNTDVQQVLGNDQDIIADFTEAMEDSGIALETFEGMSSTTLMDVASEWKSTGGDISDVLARLGVDLNGMAENIRSTFDGLATDGSVTKSLQDMGYDLDQLSVAMSNAGITSGQLYTIGAENFSLLAQSAGGDIETLVWMIQNYNNTPVVDKEGTVTVDDAQLRDAQGRVYTWNSEQNALVDQDGVVAVDDTQLVDAQGRVYTWNGSELKLQEGSFSIDTGQIEYGMSLISAWNNAKLNAQSAKMTVTNLYRTVYQSDASGGGRSAPASAATLSRMASTPVALDRARTPSTATSPVSSVSAMGLAATARSLASDPTFVSRAVAQTVAESDMASRRRASSRDELSKTVSDGGVYIENQNFETRVVRADEDLYAVAPIIYRNATREARLMSK